LAGEGAVPKLKSRPPPGAKSTVDLAGAGFAVLAACAAKRPTRPEKRVDWASSPVTADCAAHSPQANPIANPAIKTDMSFFRIRSTIHSAIDLVTRICEGFVIRVNKP
jgi:hypothetical protein